jgi:Tol biopolymer transport system component
VDLADGTPRTITDWSSSVVAWSRDGVILLSGRDGRLYRVPDAGGQPVPVTELDRTRQEIAHSQPIFLPDGRRFIFNAQSQDASKNALFLGSLDGAARTHLLDGLTTVAYADGFLLFQREGTLLAQRFDETAGRLIGDAAPVIEGIFAANTPNSGFAAFTIARNGTLAYRGDSSSAAAALVWFDRQGNRVGTVGDPGSYENPQLSRDGRWLAVCRREGSRHDIWVVERNLRTRLTSDPAVDDFPVWSADDKHVIFASNRKGTYDLYRRAADGSGTDDVLLESPEGKRPTDVSPDGRLLLFTVRTRGGLGALDVWGLPLVGDRKPFPIISSAEFNEWNAVFSPNGQWIAYQGNDSGAPRVYLQPFPSTGERVSVSTAPATFPKWDAGGRQIFYNELGALWSRQRRCCGQAHPRCSSRGQPGTWGGWTIGPGSGS